MHLVDSNVRGGFLAPSDSIELSFDRLLLPLSIARQTFVLAELVGNSAAALVPTITYDPVARVVTITPLPDEAFVPGQAYQLTIVSPSGPTDTFGLRTIDGATLSQSSPSSLTFLIEPDAGTAEGPLTSPPDFCGLVLPIFASKCGGAGCHGAAPALPAMGLELTDPQGVMATAIGRVAEESNTGPLAGVAEAPTLAFTQDVPIIDPGPQPELLFVDSGVDGAAPELGGGVAEPTSGNPAHSWLMYKLLMAAPSLPCSSSASSSPCDAGAPVDADAAAPNQARVYSVACDADGDLCPIALSTAERTRLAALIPGREMPYPADPTSTAPNPQALTVPELEIVSSWIAAGAPVPIACP